jgi:propionyl-CoA carboxylase beta chain
MVDEKHDSDRAQEFLGGASIHGAKSGVAHLTFKSDIDALLQTRRLINFLQQHLLVQLM